MPHKPALYLSTNFKCIEFHEGAFRFTLLKVEGMKADKRSRGWIGDKVGECAQNKRCLP